MANMRVSRLWPSHTIAFEMSRSARRFAENRIKDAVADWNNHTKIELLEYPTEWLVRFPSSINPQRFKFARTFYGIRAFSTDAGWKNQGLQYLYFLFPNVDDPTQNPDYNANVGALVHEIGHVLGLWHEQQRMDRDDHVIVNPFLMSDDEYKSNYAKKIPPWTLTHGAYDCNSVMHYPEILPEFTINPNGNCTSGIGWLRRSDGTGGATWLSQGDIDAINNFY